MTSGLEALMERALRGMTLAAAEARELPEPGPEELPALFEAASLVRTRAWGRVLTYSRKVFLPLTNLCRDRCGYCTFRKEPDEQGAWTMLPADVEEWVSRGLAQGCKEALFCLGDRPESAYPGYRALLRDLGHETTAEYLYRACGMALERGLLPHTNAGVLTRAEMERLKEVNASLGLMLESVSERLRQRGMPHHRAPDKAPAVRLRMIREAGELRIPFTTGILIGIGETWRERVESLLAIRALHEQHGHIQEVIVQSFRAKPLTPMAGAVEPDDLDLARTLAVARLLLPPEIGVQAPPNLSPGALRLLLQAGLNDFGGISPVSQDYINPEAPWPHVERLAALCAESGFALGERLAIYPRYIGRPGFLAERMDAPVRRLHAQVA